MSFESELATAWEETGTEGMQFFIIHGRPFSYLMPRPIMIREEIAFNCVFFSVQSRYVCVSVLLQWGRMRAWEIERAAMLAHVRQTPVEA